MLKVFQKQKNETPPSAHKTSEAKREPHDELAKLAAHLAKSGGRLIVLFEARSFAGKGGVIRNFTKHLGFKQIRVVAPIGGDRGEWYFTPFATALPKNGEIAFFETSWYRKSLEDRTAQLANDDESERVLHQTPPFEQMLIDDGFYLFKYFLSIGKDEQSDRLNAEKSHQQKRELLTQNELKSVKNYDLFSKHLYEVFARTHTANAPWFIADCNDKRSARSAVISHLLDHISYDGKDRAKLTDCSLVSAYTHSVKF
ncbi:hypothetical protein AGMMS50229_15980 [Campylobacterota bacterium]|nr:hypothetical protein AGMMS50229_15980 [Campylobacterota bacterium]